MYQTISRHDKLNQLLLSQDWYWIGRFLDKFKNCTFIFICMFVSEIQRQILVQKPKQENTITSGQHCNYHSNEIQKHKQRLEPVGDMSRIMDDTHEKTKV